MEYKIITKNQYEEIKQLFEEGKSAEASSKLSKIDSNHNLTKEIYDLLDVENWRLSANKGNLEIYKRRLSIVLDKFEKRYVKKGWF